MKKLLLTAILCYTFLGMYALNEGDIMFVGFDADSEQFAFVNLAVIPSGTMLVFSDGEGTVTWTSPNYDVQPGNVINYNGSSSSIGSATLSGNFNIASKNEIIEVTENGNCLAGISNDANTSFDACSSLSSSSIVRISGDEDVMSYTGSTECNGTTADCRAMIANPSNWTTADGGGSQSNTYNPPSSFSGSALPVRIIEFNVSIKETSVLLLWSTAYEENNDYFQIEKSFDGRFFEAIGKVEGSGTSAKVNKYSFTDYEPNLINYYRLKQVDYDGSYDYSHIINVKQEIGDKVQLTSNNVSNTIKIENGFNTIVRYSIVNTNGAEVLKGQIESGYNTIDATDLNNGMYFISFYAGDQVFTEKIYKF